MKCPRCGTAAGTSATHCVLCRRPFNAPAGWEIPEHDHTGKTPRTQ